MKKILSAGALALCAGLAQGQVVEGFENVGLLPGFGWTFQNASQAPVGSGWFQGDPLRFVAQSGPANSYIAADFGATAGASAPETISAWLVSPVVVIGTGSTIRFFTRTESPVQYADRLQVRLSTDGGASVIPTTPTDVGSFTNLLLDINPTYATVGGYPTVWTQFEITIPQMPDPLPCRVAFRYVVEQGGPQGSRSNYIGLDTVQIGSAPTGGCCLPDTTCLIMTEAQCVASGGVYQGTGLPCPTSCPAPADLLLEVADAGDLPGTAQPATGDGALARIRGQLTAGDADMYRIKLCTPNSFSATTTGGANIDTQLFLFTPTGLGIAANDDDPVTGLLQSRLSAAFTSLMQPGEALLAVSQFDNDPLAGGQQLWLDQPTGTERAPDGPAAASAVDGWSGTTNTGGMYTITLSGACYLGTPNPNTCYANCDDSTQAPVLNVADFTCFLQRFAAGSPYANCDESTQAPVLNVADFTCFLQRFAAGCP